MDNDPLAEPDRIAFAGDWHADANWGVSAILEAAERDADVIIHVGDFGYRFRKSYLSLLDQALAGARMPLLFVDGNHEDHRWLARQPLHDNGLRPLTDWIWHIPRGFRWEWAGVRFVGLGGAHSVDAELRRREKLMWQRQERITAAQAAAVIDDGRADVLVSHDCPAGVRIPGLDPAGFPKFELTRSDQHRALLRTVVDTVRPIRIWHGHFHRRHASTADFGYGPVIVNGLDANGTTLRDNLHFADLAGLTEAVRVRA